MRTVLLLLTAVSTLPSAFAQPVIGTISTGEAIPLDSLRTWLSGSWVRPGDLVAYNSGDTNEIEVRLISLDSTPRLYFIPDTSLGRLEKNPAISRIDFHDTVTVYLHRHVHYKDDPAIGVYSCPPAGDLVRIDGIWYLLLFNLEGVYLNRIDDISPNELELHGVRYVRF